MLKKEYYCLVAGLPDLFFKENKLEFNGLEFREELKTQLSLQDYKLLEFLFLPFDNKNLIRLLFQQNDAFNAYGLITEKDLEFELSTENEHCNLPEYILAFLKWHNKKEINEWSLEAENKLQQFFYEYTLNAKNEFLRDWLRFEFNLKNILTAFNCERFNYDRSKKLILTEQNPLSFSLLENKTLKPELFEDELPFAHQIFKVVESEQSWIEKEKALDKIKWNYLDEYTFFHYFTIEKVLSYVIKILITERWLKLDAETGKLLLNKLLNELKTNYEFSDEFSLNK